MINNKTFLKRYINLCSLYSEAQAGIIVQMNIVWHWERESVTSCVMWPPGLTRWADRLLLTRRIHTVTASQTVTKKRKLSSLAQPPDGLEMSNVHLVPSGDGGGDYDSVRLSVQLSHYFHFIINQTEYNSAACHGGSGNIIQLLT